MPIIPPFDAPPPADAPAPEQPARTIVCTIEETDSGDWCRWCGLKSGKGHGVERG